MQLVTARRASSRISVRDVGGKDGARVRSGDGRDGASSASRPDRGEWRRGASRKKGSKSDEVGVGRPRGVDLSTIPQHVKPPGTIARLDAYLEASFLFRSLDGGMRRTLPFLPKSRQLSPGERSSGRSGRLLHSGRGSARYMVVEGALECFYIVVEGALECFVAAEGAAAVRQGRAILAAVAAEGALASSPSCIAARARRPSSHAPSACSMRPSRDVFREFELPKCLHQRMRFEQVVACNPCFDSLSECGRLNLPTP